VRIGATGELARPGCNSFKCRGVYYVRMMKRLLTFLFSVSVATAISANDDPDKVYDLLVYGGTPAGVAAACSAAGEGHSVVLVEPYSFVGGMPANGLTHTDQRSLESLTGFWWDFNQRVITHYADKYGADSEQAKSTFEGNFAEPKVNQLVFEQMLAEHKTLEVITRKTLDAVMSTRSMPSRILGVVVRATGRPDAEKQTYKAKMFIDASYEGDLMAQSGVKYIVGREDQSVYGEPVAKDVPEGGDFLVQGYNYRWVMTHDPALMLPAPKPEGYDRAEFLPLLDLFKSGKITHVFGIQHPNGLEIPEGLAAVTSKAIYKLQPPLLPNRKADINDMSRGVVRLSMPDINDDYPDANEDKRQKIVDRHTRYQVGMLYFLQNDEAVPDEVRKDARSWGFCKDEWPAHNHLPEQLYIREARRMIGQHVFTQNDTRLTDEDVRIPLIKDSIAIGDYSHNCHGAGRTGGRFDGKHYGEFYVRNAPFQVAYGTLVPNEVTNLLVPVAASASHVGFGALRLEPIWTAMGQAAGLAVHLSLKNDKPVQLVDVPTLQALLHKHRAATLYVSDVPPGHPDFAAVQKLGMLGGLHGLYKPVDGKQPDWKPLFGQYAHALDQHEVDLNKPIDAALLKRWIDLAGKHPGDLKADGKTTRGDVIRALFSAH